MSSINPEQLLKENLSDKLVITAYDFTEFGIPTEVIEYIQKTWSKTSDDDGGTYTSHKPIPIPKPLLKRGLNVTIDNNQQVPFTNTIDLEKNDGSKYIFYDKMNDTNKSAMDVMGSQGMKAAVKHMFTDQRTGKPLTYSEMRSLYG